MISWYWIIAIVYASVWLTLLGAVWAIDGDLPLRHALGLALWPLGIVVWATRGRGKGVVE